MRCEPEGAAWVDHFHTVINMNDLHLVWQKGGVLSQCEVIGKHCLGAKLWGAYHTCWTWNRSGHLHIMTWWLFMI